NLAMKSINLKNLASRQQQPDPPVILDVRLEDDFETAHIEGSLNRCVFEVSFLDRIADDALDPARDLVIYGSSTESHEARMAAEKLERLGFANISILAGGLAAWKSAGFPVTGNQTAPLASQPPNGRYPLDLDECRVVWTGRNL